MADGGDDQKLRATPVEQRDRSKSPSRLRNKPTLQLFQPNALRSPDKASRGTLAPTRAGRNAGVAGSSGLARMSSRGGSAKPRGSLISNIRSMPRKTSQTEAQRLEARRRSAELKAPTETQESPGPFGMATATASKRPENPFLQLTPTHQAGASFRQEEDAGGPQKAEELDSASKEGRLSGDLTGNAAQSAQPSSSGGLFQLHSQDSESPAGTEQSEPSPASFFGSARADTGGARSVDSAPLSAKPFGSGFGSGLGRAEQGTAAAPVLASGGAPAAESKSFGTPSPGSGPPFGGGFGSGTFGSSLAAASQAQSSSGGTPSLFFSGGFGNNSLGSMTPPSVSAAQPPSSNSPVFFGGAFGRSSPASTTAPTLGQTQPLQTEVVASLGAFGRPTDTSQPVAAPHQETLGATLLGQAGGFGGGFGAFSQASGGGFSALSAAPSIFGNSPSSAASPTLVFGDNLTGSNPQPTISASGTLGGGSLLFGGTFGTPEAQPRSVFDRIIDRPASRPSSGSRRGDESLRQRAARFGPSLDTPAADLASERSGMQDDGFQEADGDGVGKGTIEGTCTSMCPPTERAFRERMRDIDSFERAEEGGPPILAVKKFARNVEQVVSNFRTLGTLQRTQAHLLSILDRRDIPLEKIHHFLWDRCRGVRQDLFVQGYEDAAAIALFEEHVRFMILAEHELSGYSGDKFNSHLNLEQINKACISLNGMYELARSGGSPMPNEGEFRAYHLILLMGTHGKYRYNSTEYRKALKDCEAVRHHPDLKRAFVLRQLLATGNWAAYFRKTLEAPYLLAALAHLYFPALRGHAVNVLARTNGTAAVSPLPLDRFVSELRLDSLSEAEKVCQDLKLSVGQSPQGFQIQLSKQAKYEGMPVLRSEQITRKGAATRSSDVTTGTVSAAWDPHAVPDAGLPQQVSQTEGIASAMEQINQRKQEIELQMQAAKAASEAAEASRRQAMLEQAAQQEDLHRRRQAAEAAAKEEALRREEARKAAAEKERQEMERRQAEEEAARQREAEERRKQAELRRKQEEEQRREAEARQRAEEEAERQRLAAEAAERRRLEEERRAQEEAERRRKEAEEAARRRQELIRRNQARAGLLLAAIHKQHTTRRWFACWHAHVRDVKLEKLRKEERRLQALAACRVGPFRRPVTRLQKPASSPPAQQASPGLRLPLDLNFDMSPAFLPLLEKQRLETSSQLLQGELFFKLCLLHSARPDEPCGSPSSWFQRALLGCCTGNPEGPPAKRKFEVTAVNGGRFIVRSAVRDVSWMAERRSIKMPAVAGISATLLLIDEQDDPSDISPRLRSLTSALPKRAATPGPCLLVLVASSALLQPVEVWLKEELAAGAGEKLSKTRVAVMDGTSLEAVARDATQALTWMTTHAPPQLSLQASSLADVARSCLEQQMQRLVSHWTAEPQHYLAAFEAALAAAGAKLEAAAASARALGGWPPPDCFLSTEAEWLPDGWWSEERCRAQQQLLCKLSLPPFPASPDSDEAVAAYVALGLESPSRQGAPEHWRLALEGAFQQRLGALDTIHPAVTLEDAAGLPPPPMSRVLPQSISPQQAREEERPKRRPLSAGSNSPRVKLQRTQRLGSPSPEMHGQRLPLEVLPQLSQDLFADLSIEEEEPPEREDASALLQKEFAEHSAWMKRLLAGNVATEVDTARQARKERASGSVQEELAANYRFNSWLHVTKGSF